jgi:hypothetical protein
MNPMKLTSPQNLTGILDSMMAIEGALGAAIVDAKTGTCLAEKQNPDQIAVGEAAVISTDSLRTMARLGRIMTDTGNLEDMVSTFHGRLHITRPLQGDFLEGLFLFLVLERNPNSDVLAMARYQLMHTVFGLSLMAFENRYGPASATTPQNFLMDAPINGFGASMQEPALALG